MLTRMHSRDEARVLAWAADRNDRPFHCPECRAQVILKQGAVRVHHFAHVPPVICQYGRGETESHRRCKQALYEGLRTSPGVAHVELEFPVGNQRADVVATIRGVRVAFEVQVSTLSLESQAPHGRLCKQWGRCLLDAPVHPRRNRLRHRIRAIQSEAMGAMDSRGQLRPLLLLDRRTLGAAVEFRSAHAPGRRAHLVRIRGLRAVGWGIQQVQPPIPNTGHRPARTSCS